MRGITVGVGVGVGVDRDDLGQRALALVWCRGRGRLHRGGVGAGNPVRETIEEGRHAMGRQQWCVAALRATLSVQVVFGVFMMIRSCLLEFGFERLISGALMGNVYC